MASTKKAIGVGVIGFGTIGTGVVRVLRDEARSIEARLGHPVRLVRVADLDTRSDRGVKLRKGVLTKNARALIADPKVDVVVELIGGIEPARAFMLEAIAAGKSVVTANKALLSLHGPEIARAAERAGVAMGFEASVGGGIPIMKVLRESLAGDENLEVYGIVNGTANYILTEMSDGRGEFDEVLARAQAMGLAEADPTYDVDGIDSLHKLVILVAMAFGKRIQPKRVHVEGIRSISSMDIAYAHEFGYEIKLLAVARDTADGVEARVHPSMVPRSHLLSQVRGAFNAVCLRGRALGTSLYYGQGAGMMPTATAVVADIIDAARNMRATASRSANAMASAKGTALGGADARTTALGGADARTTALGGADARTTALGGGGTLVPSYGRPVAGLRAARVIPMASTSHEHYIRLSVADKPGVLARISTILGKESISIATVAQHENPKRGVVPLVLRTHRAEEAAMNRALAGIARLSTVRGRPVVIRVEESLGQGGD